MTPRTIRRGTALGAAIAAAGLVATGAATAGPATTDADGNFAVVDVDLNPPQASTKTVHRGAGVNIHFLQGNRQTGARSPYSGDLTIRLPRGMRTNAAVFPDKCPLPTAQNQLGDESRCKAKSRIGTGTAELDARPTFAGYINGAVHVYNGELRNKRPTLILMFSASVGTTQVHAESDLEYSNNPIGPYGGRLQTIHPVPDPTAGFATTTRLDLSLPNKAIKRKVHGTPVRTHLVETPRKCGKSWAFELVEATTQGDRSIAATDTVGCARAPAATAR